MSKRVLFVLMLAGLALAACSEPPSPDGDPRAGEALFNQQTIGSAPGCAVCHSTQTDGVRVGPPLAGIAGKAAKRVEEQTADEYLRISILEPDTYVVEGFIPGVMYQQYEQMLSDQQVENLVAYLLTLK